MTAGEELAAEFDEFDLDLAFGELGGPQDIVLYLPTGRDIPNETCNTQNATCPNTCHATCPATCPNTCHATCPNTCRATCPDTCRATCPETCGATCQETCGVCQTFANTHCFTCRSNCHEP
ncbi:hypothetical protein [Kribbella sp. NPDC049227]|uniref:hypothetical protein n=1 Tax=Kribbella sp. NPDC049227 TaxID=3364113 RepID=UPI003712FB20